MNKYTQEVIGKKFGKLLVIDFAYKKGHTFYKCKCECGNIKIVSFQHLKTGHTQSCGCLKKEIGKLNYKHGMEKSRLYHIWQGIKRRCLNKKEDKYDKYGGRGIKICEEWKNNSSNFINWALNNGYKDNLTIDRIDVNGDYEPLNCRWVTMKEQSINRRNTVKITYNNQTLSLVEWCNILNLNYKKIYLRIYRSKWSIEKAFNTP